MNRTKGGATRLDRSLASQLTACPNLPSRQALTGLLICSLTAEPDRISYDWAEGPVQRGAFKPLLPTQPLSFYKRTG